MQVKISSGELPERELQVSVARTSLRTKLSASFADKLAEDIVDAVMCIYTPKQELDLFMVEVLHMKHRLAEETKLVKVFEYPKP